MADTEARTLPAVSLHEIVLLTARIGIFAFGGGMSGIVFQEVVTKRKWLSEDEFLSGLAVSQIIPGANVTNLVVYIGQQLRGAPGAASAVFGLLFGPFFFVIGAFLIYDSIKDIGEISAGLMGITAAAMGIVLMVVIRGALRGGQGSIGLVVTAATTAAVALLHFPLIPVVLLLAPISVALAWLRLRRHG
jgi:chromate transporter